MAADMQLVTWAMAPEGNSSIATTVWSTPVLVLRAVAKARAGRSPAMIRAMLIA